MIPRWFCVFTTTAVVTFVTPSVQADGAAKVKAEAKVAKPKAEAVKAKPGSPTVEVPEKTGPRSARHRPAGIIVPRETFVDDPYDANLLREAYIELGLADHDYDGHRVKAMHEIEAAAKHVGISLHGDGHIKVAQAVSDQRLRNAAALLREVTAAVSGKGLVKLREAYEDLDIALRVR